MLEIIFDIALTISRKLLSRKIVEKIEGIKTSIPLNIFMGLNNFTKHNKCSSSLNCFNCSETDNLFRIVHRNHTKMNIPGKKVEQNKNKIQKQKSYTILSKGSSWCAQRFGDGPGAICTNALNPKTTR